MNKVLKDKLKESLQSILPVAIIILIISIIFKAPTQDLVDFVISSVLLIAGLVLFSVGAEISMMTIAEKIGAFITKRKLLTLLVAVGFIIGFLITVAEPDLWVLSEQFPAIPAVLLIGTVALGVGLFLVIALLRITFQIKMSTLLLISYGIIFLIAIFVDGSFVPVSFDSGGVTTGPITVPFILALGYGVSKVRGDKASEADSFGLVGICSVGPILAVLILGLFFEPSVDHTSELLGFGDFFVKYLLEILIALVPFIVFFIIFQVTSFKLSKKKVLKIMVGFLLTYAGLVLFLVGANHGFLPIGQFLGKAIASLDANWLLIPIGMLFGFTIVVAEPAITVLTHQVEDVTSGAIPRKVMNAALSIGVSIAVGLACLRVLYEISIWWIIVPGYITAILITFFVPNIFTSIAFDSGGAASGAMTATFLVPFAIGAATALGHDVLRFAFGLVAFVALAPLLTIQILGLIYNKKDRRTKIEDDSSEDEIINVEES